jgi:hypothetical protein
VVFNYAQQKFRVLNYFEERLDDIGTKLGVWNFVEYIVNGVL